MNGEAGISSLMVLAWGVSAISEIRLGLRWKLRNLVDISLLTSLSSIYLGCDSWRFHLVDWVV